MVPSVWAMVHSQSLRACGYSQRFGLPFTSGSGITTLETRQFHRNYMR